MLKRQSVRALCPSRRTVTKLLSFIETVHRCPSTNFGDSFCGRLYLPEGLPLSVENLWPRPKGQINTRVTEVIQSLVRLVRVHLSGQCIGGAPLNSETRTLLPMPKGVPPMRRDYTLSPDPVTLLVLALLLLPLRLSEFVVPPLGTSVSFSVFWFVPGVTTTVSRPSVFPVSSHTSSSSPSLILYTVPTLSRGRTDGRDGSDGGRRGRGSGA